jgi:hypothetical protein
MKLVIIIFALLASMLILDTQAWSAPIVDTHNKTLLRELRNITKRCVEVEHSADGKSIVDFRSRCPIFTIDADDTAYIFARGQWLSAHIAPAADADGDDLAYLIIQDSKGRVIAQKNNVLAFGHIVYALAGQLN